MALCDQHLHSRHSMDSDTDPAANVEQAIARGLAGLTFTEHFDTEPSDWQGCRYDDASYSATIALLRQRYGKEIFIGKGIEVCYQPDRMDFILSFLEGHRFDLVILSVHYFAGKPVHRREHWMDIDVEEGTRRYLNTVLEAAQLCSRLKRSRGHCFDVLGHLDLVKRYTQRFAGSYDVGPCAELIEEILQIALEAELVPEINTSSLRQGLSETMPGKLAVDTYARLGGTAMSIGSDAHRSDDIGAGFDEATSLLRAAGLQRTAVFKERQREDWSVEW